MSATNRGDVRRERDAYQTPVWAVEAIVREIAWGTCPRVLEPCAGDGVISNYIDLKIGHAEVTAFDIEPSSSRMKQQDFLEYSHWWPFDFCITNPPFSLAKEFIDKALEVSNCAIMLLPKSFDGSVGRKEWWQRHPPTAEYTLSRRPSFTGDGKTDSEVYQWLVFDSTGRQKRGWYWL